MKVKRSKAKFNKESTVITRVVACASIAMVGVANGRNIPVVFVEKDDNDRIHKLLSFHNNIRTGNCVSQWGMTEDNKYVALVLDFSNPLKEKIVVLFDVIKFGIVIDQILAFECLYLMIGTENSKLSNSLNDEKILLEIPNGSFGSEWDKIYRKEYSKFLKDKHNISLKVANEIFDKTRDEISVIKKIRLK